VEGEEVAFTVPRPLPAFPLLDMASEAQDGDQAATLAAFLRFLRACITEAEWPRFRSAVTRARWSAPDLLPLVQYLIQEATGRPTMPPLDSPGVSDGGMRWPSPGPVASGAGVL
jgi:hypothetical protein